MRMGNDVYFLTLNLLIAATIRKYHKFCTEALLLYNAMNNFIYYTQSSEIQENIDEIKKNILH